MSPEQRAQHYAELFTSLGEKWRSCVPVDGTAEPARDCMYLTGVRIERLEGAHKWEVTNR